MKVGLGVPQFGINSTKENLIKFIQSAEKENFVNKLVSFRPTWNNEN